MTASTDHTYEEALQSLHFAAANADVPDAQLFGTLVTARAGRNELSLLGLSPDQFTGLLARQFPHLRSVDTVALTSAVAPLPLPATHSAFVATLHARLMDEANPAVARDDADCLATIIAHACLRPDHLWRDLGLDGRDAVAAMLARFSPRSPRATSLICAGRNSSRRKWPHRSACRPGPHPDVRAARISVSAFLVRDGCRGNGRADICFVASPAGKAALTGMASANPPLRDFDATFRFHEKPRITSSRRNNG